MVPLIGVLLTVHHIINPKVPSHPEVQPTICTRVALWMAEVVVHDPHRLCNNVGATFLTGVVLVNSSH